MFGGTVPFSISFAGRATAGIDSGFSALLLVVSCWPLWETGRDVHLYFLDFGNA